MNAELLAPAGGEEQLIAAVRCGADAVYLGTKAFNARRNAGNFDREALRRAVSYCHARNVKVHVTLNTLLMDPELPEFLDTLETVAESGADAAIVQDLAAAKLVREHCPELELHASTQMAIHNVYGAQKMEDLGFSRVVLARELSLSEISEICRKTSLAAEVFVHGALCMCVSGMCYLSSLLGGRSGNRGLCAQPCRLNFRSAGRPYALSLKDMSHISAIRQLTEAGVQSFKIEGRMKRPEYVAAAVAACRTAMDGGTPDLADLQAVFSRSGFTDGYLRGARSLSMFGHRTQEDVAAAAGVLSRLAAAYRAETPKIPVQMQLTLERGVPARLQVSDGIQSCRIEGELPQEARTAPASFESVHKSLSKTGGTPFFLKTLTTELADGVMLPAASLNRLRRDGLTALLARRSEVPPKPFLPQKAPLFNAVRRPFPSKPEIRIRVETWEQAQAVLPFQKTVIIPIEVLEAHVSEIENVDRVIGELPALIFPGEEDALLLSLQALQKAGLQRVLTGQIGWIDRLKACGLTVCGGYGLNLSNTLALHEAERLGFADATLSFELPFRRVRALGGMLPRGILAYGHLPVMQFRACPAQKESGCAGCDGRPKLLDRRGMPFPLICRKRRYTTLLNPVPLALGDKPLRGIDFAVLYFTLETPETCQARYRAFCSGETPDFDRTNGFYDREWK